MTDAEILKKAVEKAVGNGWVPSSQSETIPTPDYYLNQHIELKYYYSMIFSVGFAKVFWHYKEYWRSKDDKECWRYHQHRMLDYVQEGKNPLKYLKRFLNKNGGEKSG